ncbi:O-antigen ligase family protein [Terrabacter sp. 2RAF25]|uniref:O-antigen ligase family protein n=1 Tax=Terrabacter sp. 2RAF25 TaxID=3232998 RepID=UPI003F9AC711
MLLTEGLRPVTGGAAPAPRGAHPADGYPLDASYFSRAPRHIAYLLGVALAGLPLLVPSGPGNTAVADVGMVVVVVGVVVWLKRDGVPVLVPYLLPVSLLMVAGSVAAYHVQVGVALLPVLQDLFLLAWGAAVANAVRRRRWLLEVVLRVWVWSSVLWAAVLSTGRMAGISWMAGTSAKDGGRASLTFDDPNLAANYFLIGLGLLVATSVVRRRLVRVLAAVVILLALVFTGSNGAAVGLATMTCVGLVVALGRRRGVLAAAATSLLLLAGVALVVPHVDLNRIGATASDSAQVLRDSLGRSGESSGSREELANETIGLYLGGDLVGVGPGQTKAALKGAGAAYVKEAHNDYLATLVERGALGGAGLVVLLLAVAARLGRVVTGRQSAWVRELVPRPEVLLGLGCALAVGALFYEVLHFRHVWAFLGLIAGIDPGATTDRLLHVPRTWWRR